MTDQETGHNDETQEIRIKSAGHDDITQEIEIKSRGHNDITQEINIQPEVAELTKIFTELGASNELLWKVMWADKDVRESLKATARALLNVGISIADFVPVIGDAISLLADAAKWTQFDLTPNVSKEIAVGSEGLELLSGGFLPTHAIETILQIRHDAPQIKKGLKRTKKIWTAHEKAIKSKRVADAAAVFDSKSKET
jgi:hypothetical protein